MLRSIADIARSEGEDLSDPETALACVEVFALGGRAGSADASESGYFAVRGMLAKTVTEAARFVAERGLLKEGAPILLKFVTQVAARFGLVVTQKVAARALPLVGALGGAAVNYAFIEHFQDVARSHFTVRRLERLYGKERIRSEYDLIAGQLQRQLGALASCALQRLIQPLPLLYPAGIFGLRSLLDSVRLGLDGSSSVLMLPFGLVQRRLRLVDGLLPVFALFLPGGLFPRPLAIAALLLAFVGDKGLLLRCLVGRPGGCLLRFAAGRLSGGFRWSCGGVT